MPLLRRVYGLAWPWYGSPWPGQAGGRRLAADGRRASGGSVNGQCLLLPAPPCPVLLSACFLPPHLLHSIPFPSHPCPSSSASSPPPSFLSEPGYVCNLDGIYYSGNFPQCDQHTQGLWRPSPLVVMLWQRILMDMQERPRTHV